MCSEITFFSMRPPFTHATGSRADKLRGEEQDGIEGDHRVRVRVVCVHVHLCSAQIRGQFCTVAVSSHVSHCAPKVDFWSVSRVPVPPNSPLPPPLLSSPSQPACLCGRKSRLEIPFAIQLSILIAPPAMFSDSATETTQNSLRNDQTEINKDREGRKPREFLSGCSPSPMHALFLP